MQTIVLTVHLILALCLIGVVLLQRSEGGGLGMGGGGGAMSARGAATALGKMTWALAACFIATSIWLTVIAAQTASSTSVLDRLGAEGAPVEQGDQSPSTPDLGGDLLPPPAATGAEPPSGSGDTPTLPPRAE